MTPPPNTPLLSLYFITLSLLLLPSSAAQETFIVHVSHSHKPLTFSTHRHWYSSILRSLPPHPRPARILYTYDRAVRGFSARLSADQAAALRSVPGIVSVVPDAIRQVHTTRTPKFLGLADSFGLWPNSDYADDVIVGVLDTGIWPERELLTKVAGKIVICDRGGNSRVDKGKAVNVAGGAGMIMANLDDSGEELLADAHFIPATMVGASAGNQIRSYASSDPNPTATIVFKGTVISNSPSAPRVASFSSRGPSYRTAEILKPDVIGPGVDILAAWTGHVGPTGIETDARRVEFNIISGTSMSCPHVSGLAALLKKAYPSWSPAAIKSALMTTAYNVDNTGKNLTDLATGGESNAYVHGAGHVDPNRSLDPGLVYDLETTDYLGFLCTIGYDSKRISVFSKDASSLDCDTLGFKNPGNLNYPSFSVVFSGGESVITYKRTVKNVGKAAGAVYEVGVAAPPGVEVSVSPSKLVFGENEEKLSYEVTFKSSAEAVDGAGFSVVDGERSAFGWLEWSDGDGHRVRSQIAVLWKESSGAAAVAAM
ncbi:LOW QUALITY PROTEIN: subtilisin-like protease SBT1.4 [Salvia hispanica]|uniref:LOW QUALITY PROTEIN: subtilisin-like protease SBT1.4 n=1 Tax=Salvia hispanica TaxID=49212 RepID=UPI0020099124|nr:LOW QUALITY PROTEIN: subtilisin-like protease SBT1.4 [Salvia hispanica]